MREELVASRQRASGSSPELFFLAGRRNLLRGKGLLVRVSRCASEKAERRGRPNEVVASERVVGLVAHEATCDELRPWARVSARVHAGISSCQLGRRTSYQVNGNPDMVPTFWEVSEGGSAFLPPCTGRGKVQEAGPSRNLAQPRT